MTISKSGSLELHQNISRFFNIYISYNHTQIKTEKILQTTYKNHKKRLKINRIRELPSIYYESEEHCEPPTQEESIE